MILKSDITQWKFFLYFVEHRKKNMSERQRKSRITINISMILIVSNKISNGDNYITEYSYIYILYRVYIFAYLNLIVL